MIHQERENIYKSQPMVFWLRLLHCQWRHVRNIIPHTQTHTHWWHLTSRGQPGLIHLRKAGLAGALLFSFLSAAVVCKRERQAWQKVIRAAQKITRTSPCYESSLSDPMSAQHQDHDLRPDPPDPLTKDTFCPVWYPSDQVDGVGTWRRSLRRMRSTFRVLPVCGHSLANTNKQTNKQKTHFQSCTVSAWTCWTRSIQERRRVWLFLPSIQAFQSPFAAALLCISCAYGLDCRRIPWRYSTMVVQLVPEGPHVWSWIFKQSKLKGLTRTQTLQRSQHLLNLDHDLSCQSGGTNKSKTVNWCKSTSVHLKKWADEPIAGAWADIYALKASCDIKSGRFLCL